ncbi:MAG: FtsX-like permease family protein, partial [Bacteroidota bacterium]
QFVIAFVLIVDTLVINRQYQYMQEKDKGLNDEQVLVFSSNNKHSWKNRNFIKQSVQQLSGVKEVSMTYGGLPTSSTEISSFQIDQSVYQWNTAFIQPNLIDLLDVQILTGKAFDSEIDSEVKGSVLLNATAAKALGWPQKDLVGTSIILNEDNTTKQVLGIVQDYHYESIKKEIAPLVLQSTEWEETFVVKLSGKATPSLLSEIEGIWQQYVPKHPFSYQFLDETYQGLHREDTKQGKIIFFFTLLTIIIASIGTLSLSSFIQQSKVKEIAIKKILGAPMVSIFYGLSSTLLRVLVFACLLAIPLAWLLSAEWLSAFRYRIMLSPDVFLVGIIALVVLILGLIITQSWKTATANPVDSLKAE